MPLPLAIAAGKAVLGPAVKKMAGKAVKKMAGNAIKKAGANLVNKGVNKIKEEMGGGIPMANGGTKIKVKKKDKGPVANVKTDPTTFSNKTASTASFVSKPKTKAKKAKKMGAAKPVYARGGAGQGNRTFSARKTGRSRGKF